MVGGTPSKWPSGAEWPKVIAEQPEPPDALELRLEIPPQVHWFGGHFPGEPVLAGVVQLHWAIGLARCWQPQLGDFDRVESLKFQHVVQPDMTLDLHLDYDAGLGRLRFRYEHDGKACSQGRVYFHG